jgi:prepilin-type processing-associated H-X9-DG protein/prepilin-type N-terminal cleavage/methylation domain-containing protein
MLSHQNGTLSAAKARAFSVLELLVSMAIMGVLAGLILPAVQAARESARRMECMHHLRQIGLALHDYYDEHRVMPAGWQSVPRTPTAIGWAARILPHLELNSIRDQLHEHAAIDSPANAVMRHSAPDIFLCSSDLENTSFELFREIGEHESSEELSSEVIMELPAANYLGVFGASDPDGLPSGKGEGPFIFERKLSLSQATRGTTHLLFVGERTARKLPATWLGIHFAGEDAAGRVTGQALLGPNRADADECEFDSRHPGGVNFLWADGHVAWIVDEIDSSVYRTLGCLRN